MDSELSFAAERKLFLEKYFKDSDGIEKNGVWLLRGNELFQPFSENYNRVREKESWILTDEELNLAPFFENNFPNSKMWRVREGSAKRLKRYLSKIGKPVSVLDVGCGSGWMTNYIGGLNNVFAVGLDANISELEQAQRVFGNRGNKIEWACGDIFLNIFPERFFDVIILSASIQYFPDLKRLLEALNLYLIQGGEVHVIDSPVYDPSEISKAKERSKEYFKKLGMEDEGKYYHHHSKEFFEGWDKIFDPKKYWHRFVSLMRNEVPSPFAWYRKSQL